MTHFNSQEFSRYTRHIQLGDIGVDGQRKLKSAQVLIVGCGGLGALGGLLLACLVFELVLHFELVWLREITDVGTERDVLSLKISSKTREVYGFSARSNQDVASKTEV